MNLTISLAQIACQVGDPEANFARVVDWTEEAARRGSDLVLFPELWASGYDLENWERYATPLGDGLFQRIADLAQEHRIAIGGSLLEKSGHKAYNTFTLYGPDGSLWGVYRKIHLFRLLDEEKWLCAGDSLEVAKTPWGPVGLSICYDLRFPEVFRPYALARARLVLLVAEWPERRIEHWRTLLRARAMENQIFVAAVNRVGESKGVRIGGASAVINAWGNTVVEGGLSETLLTAAIDLSEVEEVKEYIPALLDRRTRYEIRDDPLLRKDD
jgi:predicted amidohydrolase